MTFHCSSSLEMNGVAPLRPESISEDFSAQVHHQHQQPELAPRSPEEPKNIPLKASKSLTTSNHHQVHLHHHHTVYQNNEKYWEFSSRLARRFRSCSRLFPSSDDRSFGRSVDAVDLRDWFVNIFRRIKITSSWVFILFYFFLFPFLSALRRKIAISNECFIHFEFDRHSGRCHSRQNPRIITVLSFGSLAFTMLWLDH